MKMGIITLAAALALFTMGCNKSSDNQKPTDNHITDAADSSIHNFEVPSEKTEGLTLQKELSKGDYKVKVIRITRIERDSTQDGSKWTFIHTFNVPGSPAKGDPITKRGDWVNTSSRVSSSVHEQVPFTLAVTEDGSFEYKETTYHGATMATDKDWNWVSSSNKSGYDVAFLLSSKVVSQKKQDSMTTIPEEGVVTITDNKGNQVDRETQLIQKLESSYSTQIAAVKKVNDSSFTLIHYINQPSVAEIYTEVTYIK